MQPVSLSTAVSNRYNCYSQQQATMRAGSQQQQLNATSNTASTAPRQLQQLQPCS
jgi:hypothetical protein